MQSIANVVGKLLFKGRWLWKPDVTILKCDGPECVAAGVSRKAFKASSELG